MPWKKSRPTLITFYFASFLGFFLPGFLVQVFAQEPNLQVQGQPLRTPPAWSRSGTLQAQAATPTILQRAGRRKPASPRGPCSPSEKSLMALLPKTNLGLTVTGYPTFFFYIPQTPIATAEFVLLDEENKTKVYETTFTIRGKTGIASLTLPASKTLPPLAVGKTYHWYISMICDPEDRSGDIYVDGWVQRVEANPNLVSQLEKASSRDRIALYRKNDLWFDTLRTLAERRRLSPDDTAIATEWTSLLKSVGLDEIAQEPLVQP